MSDKKCAGCYAFKIWNEFGRNKNTPDEKNVYCFDCARLRNKISYSNPENKRASNLRSSKYALENKEHRNKYQLERHHKRKLNDSFYLLKRRYRSRLKKIFRYKGVIKVTSSMEFLGCAPAFFKLYFESRFSENMTWDDVYSGKIHIDHIIPISSATTEEELKKLSHYTNLQPLWAVDNLKKSNKISQKAS